MRSIAALAVVSAAIGAGVQQASAAAPPTDPEQVRELEFTGWATENGVVINRLSCDVTPGEGDVCFVLNGFTATAYIPIPDGTGWQALVDPVTPAPASSPVATTLPASGEAFASAFLEEGGALLQEVLGYMDLATDAIQDFDIGEAATYSQLAADGFAELYDIAIAAPGADSAVGQAAIAAMESCQTAWQASASALDSFDIDAIEGATELIGVCTEDLGTASDIMS